MEISNPIAQQYVSNQGLASQLNSQGNQLPVKSERFAVDNKIPAPTGDKQGLRSEADKNKNKSEKVTQETANDSLVKNDQQVSPNPAQLPSLINDNKLLTNYQKTQQQNSKQNLILASASNKQQNSIPIQSYLETSALKYSNSNLSKIDIYI